MTGLLLKDILNLKQQAKSYLFIVLIWLAIALYIKDSGFFGGVMIMFMLMVPMSAFAYDENCRWDRFGLTMPVTRFQMVLAKYLLTGLIGAAVFVMSAAVSVFMTGKPGESLGTSLALFCVGTVMASIVMPLIFKFGVEKGRILTILAILLPVGIVLILTQYAPDIAWAVGLYGGISIIFLAALTALTVAVSFSISVTIYERKEL